MKKQTLIISGLVLSMFTWGMSWPSGKILSAYGPASTIAFFRFFFTFLSLLPILLLLRLPLSIRKEGLFNLVAAGICMSVYSYLFFNGLKYGKPGAGGVLVTTLNPVISFILGLLLSKRKPTKNESAGLILGIVAGVILLEAWVSPELILSAGNIFFLLASFTWAILSKFTSRSGKYGNSATFSLWMYLVCTLLMFLFSGTESSLQVLAKADNIFWWNMTFSAVITTTIATSFYFYATTELGAEKASSFIFLVPISAALSSLFLLKETIAVNTIIGGLLGGLAVFIINRK